MSTFLKEWTVYCDTDESYHTVWQESSLDPPTTCPVNTNHTISNNLTREVQSFNIAPRIAIEEEESLKTQGYFKTLGRTISINGNINSVTTDILTWPYDVTVLHGWFYSQEDQVGDTVSCTVAPNVVIGAITSPVYQGNTDITVSQTVIDNSAMGHRLVLTDGVNVSDMGEVVSINGNIFTMEHEATYTYSPLSPTYVQQTIDVVCDMKINVDRVRYAFAEKKQRGKGLPKNIPLVIEYHNHTGNAKQFSYVVEYIY